MVQDYDQKLCFVKPEKLFELFFLKKMDHPRPLFVYFRLFLKHAHLFELLRTVTSSQEIIQKLSKVEIQTE